MYIWEEISYNFKSIGKKYLPNTELVEMIVVYDSPLQCFI